MGSLNCASLQLMRLLRANSHRLRLASLIWLSGWMLAVPLFHVHPEADPHHGKAGHVHGGTVHAVFSQDLDGEFGNHRDTTEGEDYLPANLAAVSGHSSQASELNELGFSFLSNSTDRKFSKPLFVPVLRVDSTVIRALDHSPSPAQGREFHLPHTFLCRDIPSRGPPSLPI